MRLKWKKSVALVLRNPSDLARGNMDETYVKVNGRWAYL